MRLSFRLTLSITLLLGLLLSCVDPEAIILRGTVDIVVVDGIITDLSEPQVVRLNRSKADPVTGLFGTTPITKARVELVVDSLETVAFHETIDGTYQLPTGFRGRVGHAYQLRFTLADGRQYVSTQQVMPAVPPIQKITAQFNPTSLSPAQLGGYTAAHDFYVDVQDPVTEQNFYRWDWKLWERQVWCRSCVKGVYSIFKIIPKTYYQRSYFVAGTELYEDCFTPPPGTEASDAPVVPDGQWFYDYNCRTPCWEIIYGYDINVFADTYTNGNPITKYRVAQVPFYATGPGLVDIRQFSLTPDAYQYYKLVQDQTQKGGGVADTPPAAPVGNVRNRANDRENVVGYFTASAASVGHYWLDRKDTDGMSLGRSRSGGKELTDGEELFLALNGRAVKREPPPPYVGGQEVPNVRIWPTTNRPPTAPCLLSDSRTPFKPEGWRD